MSTTKDPLVMGLEIELTAFLHKLNREESPPEELLARTREELRTIHMLLPRHRTLASHKEWLIHHKETEARYDLAQKRYDGLKADTAERFERADYVDALLDAHSLRKTMELVINRPRPTQSSAQAQGGGCLVFAALLLPAASVLTWWVLL